ncbi:MAG: enoyl-CoA hydratase/isomerase family protein [Polaribacter sp.]|jgi:methylglutaconyl-CoA hydratase|nr:enoyl-CoA hydratase/isomerase family protein [Polaribacter sp.]MBT5099598.1 enoyl-CoA hydratase/isomerase family protein [Polaribacter sp.]MBT5644927.1 enoyl-CoA hydratase/isomerase family protein [Polaribacter sp.]MBT7704301.1 enoyl-CoA hydratase/isomerase family protein [Polaribacter sp.]MDC1261145.1 enoyl-CoA hydratase/isomerase family protein [Polaribacter sp.]
MNTTRKNGSLSTKIDQKIATVEFGHPASNSFPSELLERLTKEFYALSKNEAVAVIILKSEGNGTFCAGASFDELIAIQNLEEGARFFAGFANVINAMRTCTKLIIGRVHGKAVGGGVGLAAACDYVLATDKAAIKLSELTIGIGPFVIAPAVERKMGLSGFSELALNATAWKNAYWAKEKGLFAGVFESVTELDTEVASLSEKLASYNPDALIEMKKILWKDTSNWKTLLEERAAISGQLVLSLFTKNALAKFKK